jgi:hypothetical protein
MLDRLKTALVDSFAGAIALGVKFQDVVVHSVENWDAEVAKQKQSQETEWTITIMLDW